jgi:pimeloyl-ACP methyl ester carboxylesterase
MSSNTTLEYVTSKDGTTIAFDRLGDGPPVILVSGGSVDRSSNAGLAEQLASGFSVFNYDRRGRGPSGDTQPYAIAREIEDIDAVIAAAGGQAGLYGSSSGAALALKAAAAGSAVSKLALWEPPYIVDDSRPRPPADTASIYRKLVAEDRRGDAVEYFMTKVVGMPDDFAAFARTQPWWPWQEALAHTLAYDAEIMADYSLPTNEIARVTCQTLVLNGTASFDFLAATADALATGLPNGQHRTLEGQEHNVDPTVLGPVLAEFFRP